MSRYRDPQPQVVENYSYLFNLRPNIYKYCWLNNHLIPNNSDLIVLMKRIKMSIVVISRQRVKLVMSSGITSLSGHFNPLSTKHDYNHFNPFYWSIKSLLLRIKWVFNHQQFNNILSRMKKYCDFHLLEVIFTCLKLYVALGRHNFKWVEL